MRYLGRSLGVLAALVGLYVVSDLLFEGISLLLSRHHLLPERPPVRWVPLPCGKGSNLQGTERQVQVSGRPGAVTIALQLILPAEHACVRRAFSGQLDRRLPDFVAAAFGQIEVDGRRLDRKDFRPLLVRREPLAPSAVIRAEARLPFEDRLFLSIKRPARRIPPSVDRISVVWDERLRVESISPEPDFKSDRQLSKEVKGASIERISLGLEAPQSNQASAAGGKSRRAILRRVHAAVDLPVISSLLLSLALALPMLLALKPLKEAFSLHDAGRLATATAALLIFHFATYLFSSAYGIRSIAGFSTIEEAVTEWLLTAFPRGRVSSLGRGISLVAVGVLGLAVPVLIRHRIARPCPLRRAGLSWLAWSAVLLIAAGPIWAGGRQMIGRPLRPLGDPHLLVAIGLGFLLLALLLFCFLRLLAGVRLPVWLAPLGVVSALLFMAAERAFEGPAYRFFWLVATGILGAFLIHGLATIGGFLAAGAIEKPAWLNRREIRLLMSLFLFWAAMPSNVLISSGAYFASDYSISNLMVFLAPWILPIWLGGILVLLERQGRRGLEVSDLARGLGLLAAAAVLYSPRTSWLYIPITFLLGWFTLDHILVQKPDPDGKLSEQIALVTRQRADLLASALDITAAEQALRGYRRKQMKAMISGEADFSSYKRGRSSRIAQLKRLRQQASTQEKDASELALSVGPFPSAWKNGVHGALYAAFFASPWLLLGMADLLRAPGYNTPHPLWDFSLDIILLCVRWLAIGFLFGYFFPYLRGQSGLGKGFYLFLGLTLPTLPAAAIFNSSPQQWQVILFWILQTFIHCMLLGMFAFDREVLHQAGHRDWRLLFDVQGVPMVGISLSSLAVAIGTAVATLLTSQISGLMGAALRFALPLAPKTEDLAAMLKQAGLSP